MLRRNRPHRTEFGSDDCDAKQRKSSRVVYCRLVLDSLASIAMIVAAAVIVLGTLWSPRARPAAPTMPTEPLALDGAPILGDRDARVVVIAFSDFQCPYCGKFAKESLPVLKTKYIDTGRVQFAFRHLPLTKIHGRAWRAGEAAECAARQNRFWQMHDRLFDDPDRLEDSDLTNSAQAVGLDLEQFVVCMNGEATSRLKHDSDLARSLGLYGTPRFLIGTLQGDKRVKISELISGARPIADFNHSLDRLLQSAVVAAR